MRRELQEHAVIDSFKKELRNIAFVAETDYPDIEQRLDILVDTEQKRHKKTESARFIWTFFVEKSLCRITDNLRGYDQLCRYFDEYVEYENLLFALDKHHRDHVLHSIWVMLLGFYLRKNFSAFANIGYPLPIYAEKAETPVKKTRDRVRTHEAPLWCLIALTHDLGYPIEKTRDANEIMAKMVRNFGFLKQKDLDYSFTVVHETAINELLNVISAQVIWLGSRKFKLGYEAGMRVSYAKSFEQLDHGIMSAYLLQMYLDHICDCMCPMRGLEEIGFTDLELAAKQTIIITWLDSISAHTDKNRYSWSLNDMPTLLFLCDELDEFSRYSRSLESGEWIHMKCRTELECTKDSLWMRYTFDNKDIGDEMERFFKDKVLRLHNRFELAKDKIKKVTLTCKDVRKADPVEFIYTATPSERNVKREGGSTCDDVVGYLSGRTNLP